MPEDHFTSATPDANNPQSSIGVRGSSQFSGRHGPRGATALAWIGIVLMCAAAIGLRQCDRAPLDPAAPPEPDTLGIVVMEMQAKYLVGAGSFKDEFRLQLYHVADDALNMGTLPQRQRFVVVAAELAGPGEAGEQVSQLDALMAEEFAAGRGDRLPAESVAVQDVLRALYPPPVEQPSEQNDPAAALVDRIESLAADERQLLVQQLEWFGRLALAPRGTPDQSLRDAALAPAVRVARALMAVGIVGIVAAGLGFIGLLVLLILALTGRLGHPLPPGRSHHGIYAETFAIWMFVFFGLQAIVGELTPILGDFALATVFSMFFISLIALAWPVMRGVPWRDVRSDIGLTLGRQPMLEPLIGAGGYLMALPMLAVGVGMTYVLMLVQKLLQGPMPDGESIFLPGGGPAHPILEAVANGDWLMRVQLLLLAAVAAPVVEEIMFRGVLYRHLRDLSRPLGFVVSFGLAGLVSAFIFAAIHPQGWVAIPALMSLALTFAILREWRGTVAPAIIVHAISNFLVMSLLMWVTSA